jgi:hypothetical protein
MEEEKLSTREREAYRTAECRYRKSGCCDLINATLGWKHGCPLQDCDRCWAAGGANSEEGLAVRLELVGRWLAFVKANALSAPREVLVALMRDHMTEEEVAALKAHEEFSWAMTRTDRWAKVKHTWEMASSWAAAMSSRGFTGKAVSLTVKGERVESCFGINPQGVRVTPPCPALKASRTGKHHYCGECGCGDRPAAYLDGEGYTKLDYPHLECARARPGFSNHKPLPDPPPGP